MHKKFEINQAKIKVSCQSGRKAVTHDSKSDLPLACSWNSFGKMINEETTKKSSSQMITYFPETHSYEIGLVMNICNGKTHMLL